MVLGRKVQCEQLECCSIRRVGLVILIEALRNTASPAKRFPRPELHPYAPYLEHHTPQEHRAASAIVKMASVSVLLRRVTPLD